MDAAPDTPVALGLGLLQGVTEFLPVSSSGHLAVCGLLFTLPEMSLSLTVLLHTGTLLATVAVFRRELGTLTLETLRGLRAPGAFLQTPDGLQLRNLVLACAPTAAIGLALESQMEALTRRPLVVGLGFLASAALVVSTRGRRGGGGELGAAAALLVGIAQGIAVLPGVSRSGITIASAMALGMDAPAAFRFSFLLSIPVIAGATLLELGDPQVLASLSATAWLAAAVTVGVGYASLRLLGGLLRRGHFWLFAWYLVPLGAAMLLWDVLRPG
ncbi:MAG: undecaprenyl-diphosphate phosphatase [Myxococcales bacterium]|nr:undecaprenyl-diphosphate phosphatase [Myxococcales bacterium]